MTDRTLRLAARWAHGAIAFCLLVVAGIALWAPFRSVVLPFIPDDAFYYLEIARRMGSGEGSTFDGITHTNGYHPLWTLMLVPFASLMSASREAGARAAMLVGVLLTAGGLYFLNRVAKRLERAASSLAILLPAAMLCFSSNYGMESPLVIFLFAALFWWESKFPLHTHGLRTGVATGLIASLLILSRLDTAVYVAVMDAVLLYNLLRHRGERTWIECVRPFAACVLVQALAVAGYAAVNLRCFGHLLPISALLKVARQPGVSLDWVMASWGAVPGVAAGALGIAAWALHRHHRPSPAFATAVFGTLIYLALIGLKAGREAYHWYFALPIFCSGLFAAMLTAEAERRWRRFTTAYAVFAGLSALLLAASIGRRCAAPNNRTKQSWYDKAVWMAACSPTSSVFAATDCGILGYFSERSVINLDGLTCGFELQHAIRDNRLAAYLGSLGLNSAVTEAGRHPQPSVTGGLPIVSFRTYPGMDGNRRWVHAVVEPTDTRDCSPAFRLWKIRELRDAGPPAQP